jgi:predicted MFS family arabinose efflux permease
VVDVSSRLALAQLQSGLGAARQALLAALVAPEERTKTRARLQSTSNAGIAIGAALGGLPLLSLIIPLWIVQRTDTPTWMALSLLVLNTLSVVLFQVRIARGATGLGGAAYAMGPAVRWAREKKSMSTGAMASGLTMCV